MFHHIAMTLDSLCVSMWPCIVQQLRLVGLIDIDALGWSWGVELTSSMVGWCIHWELQTRQESVDGAETPEAPETSKWGIDL